MFFFESLESLGLIQDLWDSKKKTRPISSTSTNWNTFLDGGWVLNRKWTPKCPIEIQVPRIHQVFNQQNHQVNMAVLS
jgi:hypothetical protein